MSLIRQGSSYLVIGLVQLGVDWAVFVAASALGMPVAPANLLGRVCGMLLGFWLNGRHTFAQAGQRRLGWKRFARFLGLWAVLTLVSTLALDAAAHQLGLRYAWLAKPLVEGSLAAVSFLLMRRFVYR
ncbi:GtrA family protein [Stenotrophomonas rhizophila]|uniref:GtrA family protein n=1 Tax=Stenotrophomonas rhizophila TaxID=216778 RepID=UPI001E398CE1|nr:GtrA family protein [Stenotrophomonas rhizophila]MCC7633674.1 GtrA family protein [Stenotrophomonas rhizophila]MCC7663620.1 GtrA family protein [Stenotrophomonas rhizophila]